ncbi:putative FBD-associated F-box protein At3g12840 [Rutidosis leptorrhynchoides]|uniref:putative FBD-associated F-box protein At3g12840 n=1 Tax=Rutidosis leptorrhynchoides TaxID=125765 RepID=UPI003A98E1B5
MDRIQSSFTTLQLQAGSHERPNFDDYISQMSDDVLAVILSLMPIKDAVTTSILARRWRNLWHNLGLLNFDGDPEKEKFINQISSCALSLQSLSLRVEQTEGCLIHDSVPMLPNLKKLKIAVGENRDDDSLVYLASLMNACPNLVSFSIKSRWDSPIISMKKARGATINPHKHLKIFKIKNYKGRKSDFELAAYIIETVVSLKKVTIIVTRPSMYEEAFQYSAEGLIEFTMPKGVELVIV